MSKLDRPFTDNINFAVDSNTRQLYLDLGNNEVETVVLVQHNTFSVMCTIEEGSAQLVPLACKLGNESVYTVQLINDRSNYVVGNSLHKSDRDGAYMLHTMLSKQIGSW